LRKRIWSGATIFGLALVGAATAAKAGTVTTTFHTVDPYRIIEFSQDSGNSYESTWAGKFQWTRLGGTEIGSPTGDFTTFCIELNQEINFGGTYTYDVVSLDKGGTHFPGPGVGMGAARADLISELWGRHYSQIVGKDTAAAFQLAVWEIVEDSNNRNLAAGRFRARYAGTNSAPAYTTLAQQWLDSLNGQGPRALLDAISNSEHQDQVFYKGASPIPLPAAAWSGLGLMSVVGALRLRRMRKPS
jgi:hypothetical protein